MIRSEFSYHQLKLETAKGALTTSKMLLLTILCGWATASSPARACDRPGTPTNVTAFSRFPGSITIEWTNTASEEVWWDYDVRHNGVSVPQRAGMPPRVASGQIRWRFQNHFFSGPRSLRMLSASRADCAWT